MIENFDITNGQYVQLKYQIAGVEKRIFAVCVDRAIQILLLILTFSLIDDMHLSHNASAFFYLTIGFIIYLLNLTLEYLLHGRTLGKMIFKIKVITEQSEPPSFQQCFIRWILYPIDEMIIGMVMISKHGQRIGDMASGCYVVFEEKAKAVKASITTDYQYVEEGYSPIYEEKELSGLKEKDIRLIINALYNTKYQSQLGTIADIIQNKQALNKNGLSNKEFLIRVYNDYKYYEMMQE